MLKGVTLNTSPEAVTYDGQNDVLWIELESDKEEPVLLKFPGVVAFRCEPAPAGKPNVRTFAEAKGSDWLAKTQKASSAEKAAQLREYVLTGPVRNWHVAASDCRHVQADAAAKE